MATKSIIYYQSGKTAGQNECDSSIMLNKVEFNQRHYLKCETCLWSASYMDARGNLDVGTKKVQCPNCKIGKVEIISTSYNPNETYVPPSYLSFVLTDW